MSEEQGHTPGPWIVHTVMGNGDFHWIVPADAPDFRIAKVEVFAPSLSIDCDNDMEAEGLANARLIAAAPDLLEALETARVALIAVADSAVEAGFGELADIIDGQLTKANAAISRAKAQSHE